MIAINRNKEIKYMLSLESDVKQFAIDSVPLCKCQFAHSLIFPAFLAMMILN